MNYKLNCLIHCSVYVAIHAKGEPPMRKVKQYLLGKRVFLKNASLVLQT